MQNICGPINLTKLRYGSIQDEIVKDDTRQDDILFASSSDDPFYNEEISFICESSSYSLDNEETTDLCDDEVEHHACIHIQN